MSVCVCVCVCVYVCVCVLLLLLCVGGGRAGYGTPVDLPRPVKPMADNTAVDSK